MLAFVAIISSHEFYDYCVTCSSTLMKLDSNWIIVTGRNAFAEKTVPHTLEMYSDVMFCHNEFKPF